MTSHHISAKHSLYSYHPPNNIYHMCRHCTTQDIYPVYHGSPPTYVYKYRESGTRYGDLLSGLALYNLGRMSEARTWQDKHYTMRAEEKCSLQIIDQVHFEETPFPCFMMSTFMENSVASRDDSADTFDISSSHILVKPPSDTDSPLQVTNHQDCIIWHNLTTNQEKHTISCSLLKQYADTIKSGGVPVYIWLPILLSTVLVIYFCCYYCSKKNKEDVKEQAPLNQVNIVGYSSN
ncbi:uncharacterized protein ACR2FA_002823 [Aphomia sociella]